MTRTWVNAWKALLIIAALALFGVSAPSAVGRAYVAFTTPNGPGVIDVFTMRSDGMIFPMGLRSLYYLPSLATWRVEAPVHVATVDIPGAIAIAPDGRHLFVGGCIGNDRAIAGYALSRKTRVPARLGPPMHDGACPSSYPVYQSLIVAGTHLFEVGGLTYGNGDESQIHCSLEAFRIGADGSLTKTGDAQIGGVLTDSYLAADRSGTHVFLGGGDAVRSYEVGSDGSLTLVQSVLLPGTGLFSGMAFNAHRSALYAAHAVAGSQTRVYAFRTDANGALFALHGSPHAVSFIETLHPNQAMLAVRPSGNTLYLADAKTIDAFPIEPDGSLGTGRAFSHLGIVDPHELVFDRRGKFLYDLDGQAGFMGAPAIVEMVVHPDGALSQVKVCYGGAPQEDKFCGIMPADDGPAVTIP